MPSFRFYFNFWSSRFEKNFWSISRRGKTEQAFGLHNLPETYGGIGEHLFYEQKFYTKSIDEHLNGERLFCLDIFQNKCFDKHLFVKH